MKSSNEIKELSNTAKLIKAAENKKSRPLWKSQVGAVAVDGELVEQVYFKAGGAKQHCEQVLLNGDAFKQALVNAPLLRKVSLYTHMGPCEDCVKFLAPYPMNYRGVKWMVAFYDTAYSYSSYDTAIKWMRELYYSGWKVRQWRYVGTDSPKKCLKLFDPDPIDKAPVHEGNIIRSYAEREEIASILSMLDNAE